MSAVKLKICGVKSITEAKLLRDCGIDLIGLNFIPSSSRYISFETAQAIISELEDSGVQITALFAGKPLEEINDYANRLRVDYVQLHGNEPAEYAKGINAKVIRAIGVESGQSAAELIKFINGFPADYFVLDRFRQGHGELIDAELAAEVIAAEPDKIFLAGGLSPDNLAVRLAQTNPYGIDIAGGVRDNDDKLEIAKVKRCVQIIGQLTSAELGD
ncbi:MAG TPA: phosphoribosylanthranilate isomerase [Candidatus Dormibacteraeota bacterium]|nr:phosphoribosylanthranilate isomerase [Candidatus Dormibacteraeota bacterium]